MKKIQKSNLAIDINSKFFVYKKIISVPQKPFKNTSKTI